MYLYVPMCVGVPVCVCVSLCVSIGGAHNPLQANLVAAEGDQVDAL